MQMLCWRRTTDTPRVLLASVNGPGTAESHARVVSFCMPLKFNPPDLFRSLLDDITESNNIRNKVATSPELSGVTYVQGAGGVWGLPHVLQVVDSDHLEKMRVVVAANEESIRAADQVYYGADYVVNVWVGLTGPAVFAGHFFR